MVTYLKMDTAGTERKDFIDCSVNTTIGEYNSCANFSSEFDNRHGINKTAFNIGDEVEICSDKDNLIYSAGSPGGQFTFNTSGTYVTDTINNVSGLVVGSCYFESGKLGDNCMHFVGSISKTAGSIFISGNNFQYNNDLTIVMWLYPETLGYRMNPIQKSYGGEFAITQEAIGGLNFYHGNKTTAGSYYTHSFPGSNLVNTWAHIVIVRDQSDTGSTYWYKNGNLKGAQKDTFLGSIVTTGSPITIGNGYVGSTYAGYIDDLRIYNKALTPTEISSIYNLGQGTEKTNNASEKIFTGIIEDINFKGTGQNEIIEISGRDYSARLMDVTIEPEVYSNQEISVIIKDIIDKYVKDITYTNVATTTLTLVHMAYNQTNVFDAIKQLADLCDHIFWVDVNKDLHFVPKSSVSSGQTLNNTNVLRARFKEDDDEIANKIWVYGDTYLTKRSNSFTADGAGSVFTLDYKPHDTEVTIDGTMKVGGVYQMSIDPTGTHYVVDYNSKNIIFISGVNAGNNIPALNEAVVVKYNWDKRIVKYGQDENSIISFGPHTKVINDKNIKDPRMAVDILQEQLQIYNEPKTEGSLDLKDIIYLIPGQTIIVNLPNHNVDSETFTILSVNYDFNAESMLADEILQLRVGEKGKDVMDTLKKLILDIKQIQASDTAGYNELTRIMSMTGSIGLRHNWYLKTLNVLEDGSNFILGNPRYDCLGDGANAGRLGSQYSGTGLFEVVYSGGSFI